MRNGKSFLTPSIQQPFFCHCEALPQAGLTQSQNRDDFVTPLAFLVITIFLAGSFSSPLAHAKDAEAAGLMPPGLTRCVKSTCVPTQQAVGPLALPLNGLQLFEYWGFNLYTAALYAPAGTETSAEVLADIPKSLVLHYHRKIRADQIIKAAEHNLVKNPANDITVLRPALDSLHKAFVNVDNGDTYELRYEPGKGTELLFNGETKITVPGADFQRAYFGIWLSDYSLNSKLRDALLGKTKR